MSDELALLVGGRRYRGWTDVRVTRGLLQCSSDFDIAVSERWQGQQDPWQILPFAPCQILLGSDPVLTGYVNDYGPTIDAHSHAVRITGRSKTQDLIDCGMDIPSGQFAGYTLAAICVAVCKLYTIDVVVATPRASMVVPNANIQRCETAWRFLERLCRLAGVLATDDELGRLVLADIGASRFSGRLQVPGNVSSARGKLSSRKRFSHYIVKGQMRAAVTPSGYSNLGGEHGASPPPVAAVQTQIEAVAIDPTVPRYRPHVAIAESQLSQAQMQERANWMMNYAAGQATQASLQLRGGDVSAWRQPDGTLWQINQLGPVTVPQLAIDQDLLVVKVTLGLNDRGGHHTELEIGPIEGYVPDPAEVKLKKGKRGKGGSGMNWSGLGGIE